MIPRAIVSLFGLTLLLTVTAAVVYAVGRALGVW